MIRIQLLTLVGTFAEDKDAAAKLRREEVLPLLAKREVVELDFTGITLTTQSFIHALISEALRQNGEEVLDRLTFKGCQPAVRDIIETVVQYVLEARGDAA
jgi:STAS-like domain of unknown function (DUF4325)